MNLEWLAIALGEVAWIGLAFVPGLLSRTLGLPRYELLAVPDHSSGDYRDHIQHDKSYSREVMEWSAPPGSGFDEPK